LRAQAGVEPLDEFAPAKPMASAVRIDERALPSAVRGPVDRAHGRRSPYASNSLLGLPRDRHAVVDLLRPVRNVRLASDAIASARV
jgi:hypothetical protein